MVGSNSSFEILWKIHLRCLHLGVKGREGLDAAISYSLSFSYLQELHGNQVHCPHKAHNINIILKVIGCLSVDVYEHVFVKNETTVSRNVVR